VNPSGRRITRIALILAAALLAGANWYQLTRQIDTSPIRATMSQGHAGSNVPTALADTVISPGDVSEILERPLFNVGRRPHPQTASRSDDADNRDTATQIQSAPLTLVGTMRWGNAHLALIRVASEPIARWIDVGGKIEGWTLKGIEKDFVVVERASREVQIPIVSRPGSQAARTEDD
jgi:hypothetical protein